MGQNTDPVPSLYLNGPVEWIQHELCQSYNLRCPVPAVRAVDQYRASLLVDCADHDEGRSHETSDVLQPLGAL